MFHVRYRETLVSYFNILLDEYNIFAKLENRDANFLQILKFAKN